ncbi:putative phage-like protein [Pseudomonas sp. Ag1]|nr:putative phage-like protein [Pseudomonas sp. Ag1]
MTTMQKLAGLASLILLAMAVSVGAAWKVQDWRFDGKLAKQAGQFQTDLDAIGNAASAEARAEQDKRLAIEQQLAASNQQHTKELSDAQRNQALLRDRQLRRPWRFKENHRA